MKYNTVLITGGTGSWGRALVQKLLQAGATAIRVMARHEVDLVTLAQQYNDPRVQPCVGDVRDASRLMELSRGCNSIFHLAALKHVPVCEAAPSEALATNVDGTQNVIAAATANGVECVIYASTDKAVAPACAYGCSKLMGEKLMQGAQRSSTGIRFMTLRSGNLLGSSGSVLPLFRRQIAQSGQVTLTHPDMTRFFIPVATAAELLLEVAERGAGGEIFLPVMPSINIASMARHLLEQAGLGEDCIKVCGIRKGEKLEERMLTDSEAEHIYRLTDRLCVIAEPDSHGWGRNGFVQPFPSYPLLSGDCPLDYAATVGFLSEVSE